MEKVKVLVIDDHLMFARGIRSIIEDEPTTEFLGWAENGLSGFQLVKELSPDVVLLDVNMPVCSGIEALKLIKSHDPKIKVLMLTINENDSLLFEALKFGAQGYLLKNILPNELITFIHMASRGECSISGNMATKIFNYFQESATEQTLSNEKIELATLKRKQTLDLLTQREKEVLLQVIKGLTNREIGNALFISENTVKNHLRNIMEKLQINNRVQVATYALNEGLLN